MKTRSESKVAFLLTGLLFLCSYLVWGWWTDSYQTMYDFAMSGELTELFWPSGNALPEYMPGGTFIFNRLNAFWNVRWIAFMMNGILFLSIFLIYRLLWAKTEGVRAVNRWAIIIFFTGFFIESVVLYHMVRTTMFAGIASLICIVFENENDNQLFRLKNLPYLLLFTLAMWIRCNVHLFVLAFLTFGMLLHGRSLKPLAPFYVVFAVAFGYYFHTVFVADHSHSTHFSFMYDWEFKLFHTADYEKSLDFSNAVGDSLTYEAASHRIFGDEVNINEAFFERVNAFTDFKRFSPSQLKRAFYVFLQSMQENLYFLLADLLLLIGYLVYGGEGIRNFKSRTILLFLAFYTIVLAISVLKMENRFLVPFQMVLLLFVVLKHKPNLFFKSQHVWMLFLFLLIDTPYTIYGTNSKVEFSKQRTSDYSATIRYLEMNYANQIVVFNGVINPQSRPFEVFSERDSFNEFYFYNYYAAALSPTFRPYLESECNCDVGKLYPFYEYLQGLNQNVVLVDNPKRIEVLEAYLRQISEPTYRFQRENRVPVKVAESLNRIGSQGDNSIYQMVDK